MNRDRVVERLLSAERILCTCHRRPDADALGSALGLSRYLRSIGKDTVVYVPETLSSVIAYLAKPGEIVESLEGRGDFDVVVVTDTAAASLLPKGLPADTPLVVIDHHRAHDDFGNVILREVEACSTGEIILGLLDAMGLPEVPPFDVAEPIYAAVVADTGGFRYAPTNAETMRLGARLLESGVDPWKTAYHLFEGWQPARLKLLSAVLDTLTTRFDGKLAILEVTRAMIERTGANDDMVEGMVNYGRMLEGAEVAALLWEFDVVEDDGRRHRDIKVSLRSKGEIDVAAIAVELGGGGHRAASGAQLTQTLDEARETVVQVVEKALS